MQKFFSFFIAIFIGLSSTSQDNNDSLWNVWKNNSLTDSNRINALKTIIIKDYLYSNPDSAFYYAQLIYELSETKNYNKGIATAYNLQGISNWIKGDHQQAKKYYEKSIKYLIEINDNEGLANIYTNIGAVYSIEGNHAKAIDYFHKALKVYEEINSENNAGICLNNIASIYHEQQEYERALGYYKKGYTIFLKINDVKRIAMSLNNMGELYKELNELDSAMNLFKESLLLKEKLGEQYGIGLTVTNIADIHKLKGELNEAMDYYLRSIAIFKTIKSDKGLGNAYRNLGGLYSKKLDYTKAIHYGRKALEISKKTGVIREVMLSSKELYDSYKKTNKFSLALNMHELYLEMKDSIQSEKNQKEIIRQEYLRISLADSIKHADLLKIKQLKIKEQQAIANEQKTKLKQNDFRQKVMYGSLIVFLLFIIFIYNRFRISQKQKQIIELQHKKLDESHKDLTDSINYAKRIQTAMLPAEKTFNNSLKDAFVFYSPKDIIAGDFYWISTKNKHVFFAVADCTGHGVPGSLVSVFCNNALNRSVKEFGLIKPAKILEKCREIIIEEFDKSEDNVNDGMDIALCSIEGDKLQYSGAHNPLWVIRNNELLETKADQQPIGKYRDSKPFVSHSFKLHKGDTIYIFSDGFVDQFGGEKGKKFKKANFKKLLLSIQDKSMNQQKEILDNIFNTWKGGLEQIDDVCVMGVRV